MINKEFAEEPIRLAPPCPPLEKNESSQWMVWSISVPSHVNIQQTHELMMSLPERNISVMLEEAGPLELKMTVKQSPPSDYTELYLSCMRSLWKLEGVLGTLLTINEEPRNRWNSHFEVARAYGFID